MARNVPTAISSRAEKCLDLSEKWTDLGERNTYLDNAIYDFRTWVRDNSVFSNDRMCLDWRLRAFDKLGSDIQALLDTFSSFISSMCRGKSFDCRSPL